MLQKDGKKGEIVVPYASKRVARTFKDHRHGLLAYFTHPITNAVAEGLNSKIQAIKRAARGFRSLAAYRLRILFYCGLDMRPRFTNSETHGISRRTAEKKVVFWVFFLRVAGRSLNSILGMHLSHTSTSIHKRPSITTANPAKTVPPQ
jgi:hypothetical protein